MNKCILNTISPGAWVHAPNPPQTFRKVPSDFQLIPSPETSSESLITTTAAERLERGSTFPFPTLLIEGWTCLLPGGLTANQVHSSEVKSNISPLSFYVYCPFYHYPFSTIQITLSPLSLEICKVKQLAETVRQNCKVNVLTKAESTPYRREEQNGQPWWWCDTQMSAWPQGSESDGWGGGRASDITDNDFHLEEWSNPQESRTLAAGRILNK